MDFLRILSHVFLVLMPVFAWLALTLRHDVWQAKRVMIDPDDNNGPNVLG
jgi:hypothetical protein